MLGCGAETVWEIGGREAVAVRVMDYLSCLFKKWISYSAQCYRCIRRVAGSIGCYYYY